MIRSIEGCNSDPSSAPYRKSSTMVPKKRSPFDDSKLLRSCPAFVSSGICSLSRPVTTYLTFGSIDYHSHPLHVDAVLNNSLQASRQLFVKRVQVLCRNRPNVDCQIDACRADAPRKIDIRAVDVASKTIFLKTGHWRIHTKGVTLSQYIPYSKEQQLTT